MKITMRKEDMSSDGRLELIRQDDGDIIVCVRESVDSTRGTGACADVEFCNSGGRSPWTLQALYVLQEAMEKDERREPWPPREEVGKVLVSSWESTKCCDCGRDVCVLRDDSNKDKVAICTYCDDRRRSDKRPELGENICEFCLEPENNGGSHGDGNCFEGDYKFGEER